MAACGLDFGTSNTTLGLNGPAGPHLAPVEGDAVTVPSAIFYPRITAPVIGRAAMAAYVSGEQGRLMRALKSVLGSALVDETTAVGRTRVTFRKVIGAYIAEVKRRGEMKADAPLDQVVLGRPVHFVDGDAAGDARAQDVLGDVAREIGFSDISFQFEPIAAALDYERQVNGEELALIADIGGGTSDFSIVRIGPERRDKPDRADDILANDGVRIGGTDFDRALSLGMVMPLLGHGSPMKRQGLSAPASLFQDLATWSSINRLYDPRVQRSIREMERESARPELIRRLAHVVSEERGHTLAMAAEDAKIAVSEDGRTAIDLAWLEPALAVGIVHDDLVTHTDSLSGRIARRITQCLKAAGVKASDIDALFLTGGSTRLAHVRSAIVAMAPQARIVAGDTFGSVGTGLAVEAGRRYGR
ncbi:Hsp70 family protein [Xanthobacter sp. VTT E-85241]|uniref:Hsp70 family protein n=1 Tax=Roseixanthobacter finlandensis TaxID=3119922 RepID=UPI0037270F89